MNTRTSLIILTLGLFLYSCSFNQKKEMTSENPFFSTFDTPFQVPAFDRIKTDHFMPAFEKGMQLQLEEIDAIVNNPDAPTFENTIAAADFSGELLTRVSSVFYNLNSAVTNEEIQAIAKEVAPLLSGLLTMGVK
jgi:peptidyl-dipeptidase Dcp